MIRRPHRADADRLAYGSTVLARRIAARVTAWTSRTGRRRSAVLRTVGALVGAYCGWRIVRAAPWLMWPLTAWWCMAAWRAGRTAFPTAEEEPPALLDPDPVRDLLRTLIGDGRGVHLSTLADHLAEQGHGPARGVPEIRAALAALGVPVRRSVKVGRRVAYGVHLDDLQRPSPTSADADAA